MPALTYELSSKTNIKTLSNISESLAQNNTPRYINYGGDDWYQVDCVIEALTPSERDALIAFLQLYKTQDIDIDINGSTLRGKQIPRYSVTARSQDYLSTVTFSLRCKYI